MKKYRVFIVAMLLMNFVMTAKSVQLSDSLVQKAWQSWEQNNLKEVENYFKLALKENPKNYRAYVGLSFLYELQNNKEKAWIEYSNALECVPNKYPYIFAVWLKPKFLHNPDKEKNKIIDLFESIIKDENAENYLHAPTYDMLAEYYQSKNKLEKAKNLFSKVNAITDWTLIGPFENISASGFANVFAPELKYNPKEIYEGKSGVPAEWFKISKIRHDNWIDFELYFSYSNSIFYGNTFVYSPKKQKALIRVGTSGSLKTFLNDELINEYFDENNNDVDTYITETELQQGWNRLLIKCGYSEIERCNFKVRITDVDGKQIDGIKISSDKQEYISKPNAPKKQIPNFAEEYFKNLIKQNPDYIENYVLLADCYLRNDKAIEAELVLRDAIKKYPNCALLYSSIIEAYSRGEKYDEKNLTFEKISTLDQNLPISISYKIEQHMENEEYDKVEELIDTLNQKEKDSQDVLNFKIKLYSTKKQIDKLVETVMYASEKYPTTWNFIYLKYIIAFQMNKNKDEAIRILKEHLKNDYQSYVLYNLADVYLKSSNISEWEKMMGKMLELKPAASGYYYHMAETYYQLQEYAKAKDAIINALLICPINAVYLDKLGDIYLGMKNNDAAMDAYRQALRIDPSYYSSRASLRELEGKKSIYSNFESVNVRNIIKNSPSSEEFPNDDAIYLLDDLRRIVYERGASEYVREIIIKVFNNKGIEDFKEYSIDYNGYNERLNIEKAVVIKKDGSEVKADISKNNMVFKTMEPNDVIHIKYKIKKLYGGKLAKHFWDIHRFNSFYPIKLLRYSVLVPEGFKFNYIAQNMDSVPKIVKNAEGELYTWSIENEPAVEDEPRMPNLEEVGKILHISTINSWQEIADWYTDIAQTKTRSSYEIKERIDSIFLNTSNLTDEEKARKIYNYITDNISYSYVPFRQSGLVPQKARDVLVNKIGDCKDMATLFIAMLKEVGIKAYYVLVKTRDEGISAKALPTINFNHAIAAVELSNKIIYCDLTANNHSFNTVPDGDVGAFYLLIKDGKNEPSYFTPNMFASRSILRTASLSLNADNSANLKRTYTRYGAPSAYYRYKYFNKSRKEQEKDVNKIIAEEFPSAILKDFNFVGIDKKEQFTQLNYSCDINNFLAESGQFKICKIPWSDALENWSALAPATRVFPFKYWYDLDTLSETIEIKIPKGFKVIDANFKSNLTSPVADYYLSVKLEKNVIKGTRKIVFKQSIIPPEDYKKFKEFYAKIIKEDGRQILLKK